MADSFKVVYLKSVKDKTKEWYLRYLAAGREQLFETAAEIIDRALREDPRGFGDPCYSYPALQLQVYMRAVQPLIVYYGVHTTDPIVFVHAITALDPMIDP